MPPLSEARVVGRAKSSYLSHSAQKKTDTGTPTANLAEFKSKIEPAIKNTCIQCHGPEKQKGKFRIDQLNPDLLKGGDTNRWLDVFEAISNSEMPPEDAKDIHLADKQRNEMIAWLGEEIQKAAVVRRNEAGATSFRRLTRYEYNYALNDLTGLNYNFSDLLPPENVSKDGFLNSSHLLQMTGMQLERYREIGLKALKSATVIGDRPKMATFVVFMEDELKKSLGKNGGKDKGDGGKLDLSKLKNSYQPKSTSLSDASALKEPAASPVFFELGQNQTLKLKLGSSLPDAGIMRVRIRASRSSMKQNEYARLQLILSVQTSSNANFPNVISERDIPVEAPSGRPQFIEFKVPLAESRNGGDGVRQNEVLTIKNNSNSGDLKVQIDYIDICAPFYTQWPPKNHTDIFIESKNKQNEQAYGREVLNNFMTKAWRRPVTSSDVTPYLTLFEKYRPSASTFEEAMVEAMSTVLASPEFLYLIQKDVPNKSMKPRSVSDFELASRLSFFLWCSIPDAELIDLATRGKLSDPNVLTAQSKRLLADPRSERFTENFVMQWLGLEALDNITVDQKLYKMVFDDDLKEAMRQEPIAFFSEVLSHNASVLDFLHCDYVMVNERLAKHYNIVNVFGPDFRKATVDPKLNRGGLLTGAGIMCMNSDGKDSHLIKRGVWIMERILNDPPPPPPPNVPEVDLTDPRILKMTVKERIADHRNKPACFSCHAKIDPWGIAFENYDAVGGYRKEINGKPVDASSALYNKQQLDGIEGLKRYLLADRQDQFVRAMVHKLATYALGRPLSFSDRANIEDITEQFRKKDDHLGDLITLIVNSDLFHSK